MKQKTKELSAKIHAAKGELDRLAAERERCETATAAVEEAEAYVAAARKQRDSEAAEAFLARRDPNPVFAEELDRAELLAASLRPSADAARGALDAIAKQAGEVTKALEGARAELAEGLLPDLARRLEATEAAYNEAVDGLAAPLIEMHAIANLIGTVRGTGGYGSIAPEVITTGLKERGLVVRRDLKLLSPLWLHDVQANARKRYSELAEEFRAAGLEL